MLKVSSQFGMLSRLSASGKPLCSSPIVLVAPFRIARVTTFVRPVDLRVHLCDATVIHIAPPSTSISSGSKPRLKSFILALLDAMLPLISFLQLCDTSKPQSAAFSHDLASSLVSVWGTKNAVVCLCQVAWVRKVKEASL